VYKGVHPGSQKGNPGPKAARNVSNSDLTSILPLLLLLVGLAQLLGYLSMKLREPKVVGEMLAGIVLGPPLLRNSRFLRIRGLDDSESELDGFPLELLDL
jgi:hypothetical protein